MSERNKSNLMMVGKEATVRCQRRERGGEREREREREREKERGRKEGKGSCYFSLFLGYCVGLLMQ